MQYYWLRNKLSVDLNMCRIDTQLYLILAQILFLLCAAQIKLVFHLKSKILHGILSEGCKNIKVEEGRCCSLMHPCLLLEHVIQRLRICMTEMMEIIHMHKTCYMEG